MDFSKNFASHKISLPLYVGMGIGVGLSLFCAYRIRNRRSSLFGRTRRQADELARQMTAPSCAAADLIEKSREEMERQKRGIGKALQAGKKAYLHSVA
jgi:superfamily II DNA or RNA helicase